MLHREMADGIGNHIAGKPPFPRFGLEPYIDFRPDNKDCYALRTSRFRDDRVFRHEPTLQR